MTRPSRQAIMDKAIAERQCICDWLLQQIKGGKPKALAKNQYRLLAVWDWDISQKQHAIMVGFQPLTIVVVKIGTIPNLDGKKRGSE